jgi:hypothetical protein
MTTMEDAAYVRRLFPEIDTMKDQEFAQKVAEIWAEAWRESKWEKIEDCPKNPSKDGDMKLVPHTRSTVRAAIALAKSVEEFHGLGVDMDILVAGAILHDVDKIVGYSPSEIPSKTRFGKRFPHGVYGSYKIMQKGLPEELAHLVVSHSGSATKTAPATLEAIIVAQVDHADSEAMHYVWARMLEANAQ